MSAPTITFTATPPAANVFFKDIFSVSLYSQDDIFKTYYDWATPLTSTATSFQKNAANLYSGYVIRFSCNISTATPSGLI